MGDRLATSESEGSSPARRSERGSPAKELVHVVEVAAIAWRDRRRRISHELLGKGVDEDELLEQGTAGVQDGHLEGRKVLEFAEVSPRPGQDIAEQRSVGTSWEDSVPPAVGPLSSGIRSSPCQTIARVPIDVSRSRPGV